MTDFKGNIKWIAVFLAVILVSFFILVIKQNFGTRDKTAVIRQDNKVISKIDLSAVTSPYEFTVTDSAGGSNTIRVENGKIAVIDADCPDKICVSRGYISTSVLPIVCLPHKLTITIEDGKGDIDAVSGGDIK